jgi:hypothetical protein
MGSGRKTIFHQKENAQVAKIGIALCLLMPLPVLANPVVIEPSSLLAFCVVAFWALVVEAGIVALLLTFQGLNPLRIFVAYSVTNVAVFLFVFEPLLNQEWASVPALEILVVLLDGLAIKLLTHLSTFQGDDYRGVSWLHSLITSCVGNAASYFVGNIAAHKPWEQ